eukprot:31157-Pelagococcus_subviridis.AAC.26
MTSAASAPRGVISAGGCELARAIVAGVHGLRGVDVNAFAARRSRSPAFAGDARCTSDPTCAAMSTLCGVDSSARGGDVIATDGARSICARIWRRISSGGSPNGSISSSARCSNDDGPPCSWNAASVPCVSGSRLHATSSKLCVFASMSTIRGRGRGEEGRKGGGARAAARGARGGVRRARKPS